MIDHIIRIFQEVLSNPGITFKTCSHWSQKTEDTRLDFELVINLAVENLHLSVNSSNKELVLV